MCLSVYRGGWGASQVALVVKNLPANAGDVRDRGSIPVLGRSPGDGHGNPLQYSCLENLTDRGLWWTAVHGVAKSRTRLSDLAYMQLSSVLSSLIFCPLDLSVAERKVLRSPAMIVKASINISPCGSTVLSH